MTVLLRCIKGGDLADRFTFGQQYELNSGFLVDNYGMRWLFRGFDDNYEFEVMK